MGAILNAVNNGVQTIANRFRSGSLHIRMSVVFIAINVKPLVNDTTVQLVTTRALEGSP